MSQFWGSPTYTHILMQNDQNWHGKTYWGGAWIGYINQWLNLFEETVYITYISILFFQFVFNLGH